MKTIKLLLLTMTIVLAYSCRDVVRQRRSTIENIEEDVEEKIHYQGLYLLNEGNMGNNASSLSYIDFDNNTLQKNVYVDANPNVVKELGDVGNDIAIYKDRLYMVINCSNKVEVTDAYTLKRIGQVNIPNCRYMAFKDNYMYVTSYAGPVKIDDNYAQLGFVAKVNLETLQVEKECLVGYQPDGIDISGGKIYVANSGGYRGAGSTSGYERTVSVIDLETFKEEKRIDVAYNLHYLKADKRGNIWVSSRGDYKEEDSRLFFIDKDKQMVTDTIKRMCSRFVIDNDSIYIIANQYSKINEDWTKDTYLVDAKTRKVIANSFVDPNVYAKIKTPYGLAVNPETKDIYITDAGNYVSPGVLFCFNKKGENLWKKKAGQIPAHFAFLPRKQEKTD